MPELIWNGKYDTEGRRVEPDRSPRALRTLESVSASRQPELEFERDAAEPVSVSRPPNRLIKGDAAEVLPALASEFAGHVDVVYIDPPFFTGKRFTASAEHADEGAAAGERPAYEDVWENGIDGYLQWLFLKLLQLRELLSECGSLYVHLDWRTVHLARSLLDEVFGVDCFQNEIAWCYREAINARKRWNRKHDVLLFYTRQRDSFLFNADAVLRPHMASTIAKYRHEDERGRYRLMGRGIQGSPICSARDVSPEWERTHPELVYRHYLRKGTYAMDYWNIDGINQASRERRNYPTQKPEALLERILLASSNPGSLILDCFCGSGTTPAVAARMGRRWIAADQGDLAIQTTRHRLEAIPAACPFLYQCVP